MTFEIEVSGRTRMVAVERVGDRRYRVVLDGTAHAVDAARVGVFGLSLLFDSDSRAAHDVQVTPSGPTGELLVSMAGRVVAATVNGRRRRRAADAGVAGPGEHRVVAPMPGRVVRLLVAPGEDVGARQGVVVVEAMKMENELRSPKAGRVREIAVAAGDSVEAGRLLVIIE
jgi:biotin carboxyl carrier protein